VAKRDIWDSNPNNPSNNIPKLLKELHLRNNACLILCYIAFSDVFNHGLKEKLPPTDSRLRPDQRHLENGEYEKANMEKQRLEKRQRMVC
jgi:hypothetical protein